RSLLVVRTPDGGAGPTETSGGGRVSLAGDIPQLETASRRTREAQVTRSTDGDADGHTPKDISKGRLVEETARVCEEVADELRSTRKEKAVVYCRSKRDCEEMAEKLGCGFFYAGHVDGEETLEQWKANGGFIVSTTALSTGLNYEAVKAVIHSGLPYGLIEFAQASGRAGRDPSERVDSIVLLEQGWEEEEQRTRERYNEALGPDGAAMIEYIKTEGCRRLVLGKYFDPADTIKECHDS
ncbi:hypothetical protein KCV05_g22649, partial [Aureobasidium melanogenum]